MILSVCRLWRKHQQMDSLSVSHTHLQQLLLLCAASVNCSETWKIGAFLICLILTVSSVVVKLRSKFDGCSSAGSAQRLAVWLARQGWWLSCSLKSVWKSKVTLAAASWPQEWNDAWLVPSLLLDWTGQAGGWDCKPRRLFPHFPLKTISIFYYYWGFGWSEYRNCCGG